jgi:hypothetical protein
MPHNASSPSEAIFRAIVHYLVRHPAAKDTADGIRRWWREGGEPDWPVEELSRAINRLVDRGWLTVRGTAQEPLFGANPESLEQMSQFLMETKE